VACVICEERREKRFCPAVHGKICPQCCGEQREVTLDCPSDCPYLQQSREHAKTQSGPIPEHDREALFPEIEIPEQFLYQREELIIGLSFALLKSADAGHTSADRSMADRSIADRAMTDQDLIAAISTLARSYHTMANSRLIYEPQIVNLAHKAAYQNVAREVDTMVKQFREAEQQHIGHTRLRDSEVLMALVFLLRLGLARTSGRPKSRAFVDFLRAQFPRKQTAIAGAGEAAGRLVIP
jgi:hypothetical protein